MFLQLLVASRHIVTKNLLDLYNDCIRDIYYCAISSLSNYEILINGLYSNFGSFIEKWRIVHMFVAYKNVDI